MTTEQSRSFLDWHMKEFGFAPFDENSHPQSNTYARCWQASRASLLAEIQSPECVEEAYKGFIEQLKKAGWTSCDYQYIPHEKRAIAAAISVIVKKLKGEK